MTRRDWGTLDEAAHVVDRSRRTVQEWLALPEQTTGIRRMLVRVQNGKGRHVRRRLVHLPSLIDYEATVPEPGRSNRKESRS